MNNMISTETQNFGFDFCSAYTEHIDPASSTECYDNFNGTSTNVVLAEDVLCDCTMTVEEMAEELRESSNDILASINEHQEDDGITLDEIISRSQPVKNTPHHRSMHQSRASLREEEEQCAVEGILDNVLSKAQLAVTRGIVWAADYDTKIWRPLQTDTQISNFLHGLGIRRYGNYLKYFVNRISGDPAFSIPGFFETTNNFGKVSFSDGLLDLRTGIFSERTMDDRITAVLRWSHDDINYTPNLEQFVAAMHSLAVTEEAYLRLQELCGVALHAEPSGRILYFQHHNPRIASFFTTLLGRVWSEESVSFLGLRDHEKSFRTAQVLERPVIISAKEGDVMLRDISTILALADGDGINVDRKHQEPFDFISRCILICAGRNMPLISKGGMQSLRYYLVRTNLTGELPEGFNTWNAAHYTREFLAWSLEGVKRYLANHGRFTFDEGSDIPREDASIVSFVQEQIVQDPKGKLPSSVLYEAYSSFCTQRNRPVLPKPRLIAYLRETFAIESRTVRVPWFNEGQPVFGYTGIRFDEEYQQSLEKPYDDGDNSDTWPRNSEESDEEDFDIKDEDSWSPEFEPSGELDFND